MNYKRFRQDLQEIGVSQGEITEILSLISQGMNNIWTDNWRVINEDHIEYIYYYEMKESLIELYTYILEGIPSFIKIDWDATIEETMYDGYGHFFAHYDGKEHESEGYYIFRTN